MSVPSTQSQIEEIRRQQRERWERERNARQSITAQSYSRLPLPTTTHVPPRNVATQQSRPSNQQQQQQQQQSFVPSAPQQSQPQPRPGPSSTTTRPVDEWAQIQSDEELARILQEEEDRAFALENERRRRQQQQQSEERAEQPPLPGYHVDMNDDDFEFAYERPQRRRRTHQQQQQQQPQRAVATTTAPRGRTSGFTLRYRPGMPPEIRAFEGDVLDDHLMMMDPFSQFFGPPRLGGQPAAGFPFPMMGGFPGFPMGFPGFPAAGGFGMADFYDDDDDDDNSNNNIGGGMSYEQMLALQERLGHVNRGATQETIDNSSLKYKIDDVNKISTDDKQCVICLCEFEKGNEVRRLPCLHVFHADCIDRWLRTNKLCPICKTDIAAAQQQQQQVPPSTTSTTSTSSSSSYSSSSSSSSQQSQQQQQQQQQQWYRRIFNL